MRFSNILFQLVLYAVGVISRPWLQGRKSSGTRFLMMWPSYCGINFSLEPCQPQWFVNFQKKMLKSFAFKMSVSYIPWKLILDSKSCSSVWIELAACSSSIVYSPKNHSPLTELLCGQQLLKKNWKLFLDQFFRSMLNF